MGIFSRKDKVSIGEFCQQFYDSQIFNPTVAREGMGRFFFESVFKSIVEADQSFKAVNFVKFQEETTALRLELFGLAWAYKFPRERFTIPQSIFTRQYLEKNGKLEVWDIMGEYNKDLAQSAFLTETGEQMEGRAGRARITFINEFRWGIFKKYAGNIVEPSAPTEEEKALANHVGRVVSRMLVDIKRNNCVLVKLLTIRFAHRLGCDGSLNSEALFRLGTFIFGLYEGVRELIQDISIQE